MPAQLFITGTARSGTTLLDKLLSLHPEAFVFSQPLPLLYVRVKAAFLSQSGRRTAEESHYPLSDLFGDHWVSSQEFLDFLASFRLDREFCRSALAAMVPFDGQYTKPDEPFEVLEGYRPASLHDFVQRYLETLAPEGGLAILGSKETTCEEYIPYFLACGARVLVIVRDPRDIIASLDYGQGHRFAGRRKPNLFNIRHWRKSVAFALSHRKRPDFLVLRYEDLVRDPSEVTARITDFLELLPLSDEIFESDLRSQSGQVWRSNSSHRQAARITVDSVGSYSRHLPRETDLLVQATSFAEMKTLGYEVDIDEQDVLPILESHREEGPPARPELGVYAWSEARREEEIGRWNSLREGRCDPAWFVFEEAFSELSSRLRPGSLQ